METKTRVKGQGLLIQKDTKSIAKYVQYSIDKIFLLTGRASKRQKAKQKREGEETVNSSPELMFHCYKPDLE
jgi:hypothetical protein